MHFDFFIVYYNLFSFYFMLIIYFLMDFNSIYPHNSYYCNLNHHRHLHYFLHCLDHHHSPLLKFQLYALNFSHYFHHYIHLNHLIIGFLHNFHPFFFEKKKCSITNFHNLKIFKIYSILFIVICLIRFFVILWLLLKLFLKKLLLLTLLLLGNLFFILNFLHILINHGNSFICRAFYSHFFILFNFLLQFFIFLCHFI